MAHQSVARLEEFNMALKKGSIILWLGISFFLMLLPLARDANSQMVAEGVSMTVIAEYPTTVPGLRIIRLIKIDYEPGASIPDSLLHSDEFCIVTQGALSVVDQGKGTTNVYPVGGRWSLQKGTTATSTNIADGPTTMWVYQLIEKGDGDKQ